MGVIVIATDGSPGADVALEQGLELAQRTGDSVAVVTVWQALQGDFGLAYPPTAVLSELLDSERRHAEETLEHAADEARRAGVPFQARLLTGSPAEQICALADELDARLIAVGTHGHGPVMRLLVGSVSAAVIRQSNRPVLVARRGDEPRPAGSYGAGSSSIPLASA
jgi:nucleotide-binding universal stress UspA family protein